MQLIQMDLSPLTLMKIMMRTKQAMKTRNLITRVVMMMLPTTMERVQMCVLAPMTLRVWTGTKWSDKPCRKRKSRCWPT